MDDELRFYDELVIAIVKQAVADIEHGSIADRRDAIKFFKSEWFEELTGCDGKEVLKRFRRITREV